MTIQPLPEGWKACPDEPTGCKIEGANDPKATAFLNHLCDCCEATCAAPKMTKVGFSFSDLVAKAEAFRQAIAFLRASGIGDGTIMAKILEVFDVILANLGNISAIITAIAALFGVPAPTPDVPPAPAPAPVAA